MMVAFAHRPGPFVYVKAAVAGSMRHAILGIAQVAGSHHLEQGHPRPYTENGLFLQ